MRAVLSLCNQKRTSNKGILLYDFTARTGRWQPVGTDLEIMGTRGICIRGRDLYALYTIGWYETYLAQYLITPNDIEHIGDVALSSVHDPHSMCVHEGKLLIASTGTDEVLAYRLEDGVPSEVPEVFWRASDAREDTHHVNSVASDGNRVLVSAFGPKTGQFWSSAENGYVFDVTAGQVLCEGLRHPHSLRSHNATVYFTESSRQTLRRIGAPPVIIGGYVRGCDIVDDSTIVVGSNAARRVSRSQGVVTNDANPENTAGEAVGKCSVVRVSINGAVRREYFDLSAYGKEIYDICVLP